MMKLLKKINKRIVILLLCFLFLIFFIVFITTKVKDASIVGNINKIPINENYNNIAILDNGLYILENSNLKLYGGKNGEIFSKNIPFSNGKLVGNNNKLVIFQGNEFSIFDENAKVDKKIKINYEILDVEIKNDNIFIVGKHNISVYDLNGEIITSLKTKDQIATFDLSKNKTELVVTTLDIVNGIYKSDLYIKNVEENKYISQTFSNQIIMFCEYLDNDQFMIISNKEILILNDFEIISKKHVYNFKGIAMLNLNIYLLEGNKLNVYDLDFNLVNSTTLKDDYTNIYADSNKVILYNKEKCSEYAKGKIKITKDIKNVKRTIINENGLYFINENSVKRADILLGGN